MEQIVTATGTAAIAAAYIADKEFAFDSLTLHFDAVPAAVGEIVVTLTSASGAAYNTVIDRIDPSITTLQDYLLQPDRPVLGKAGDGISVTYANPSGRTYGLRLVVREARVPGIVPEVLA